MAKIALLIGVSEYGEGLSNLPGTQADIEAVQRVLQSPQIGDFNTVERLLNPNCTQMEKAIEQLFGENRSRDDLILLYFSGHGVRDDNGTLYFATTNTEKNAQGRILTSTAVSASALQNYMGQSRSNRQVLVLDCCFSGAFARDMKAKSDEAINVKAQLGGEGRAVLTSSTATQVSYEKEGASIYTQYLVQGLETGAADRNEDGQVTVDELHEYAKEKVQEAAPTMQPEIYAVREGYKILIARAPQGDPKLIFRKELHERAKRKRGKLSPIDRRAFKFRSRELQLSEPEAELITHEVLQPYAVFWEKLGEFEQAVEEMLAYEPQLSEGSVDDLQYFQRVLKLRDEDIAPVLRTYQIDLTLDSKRQ
ncbi:MAG: caspase family protein, partial [Almyronema sp.]